MLSRKEIMADSTRRTTSSSHSKLWGWLVLIIGVAVVLNVTTLWLGDGPKAKCSHSLITAIRNQIFTKCDDLSSSPTQGTSSRSTSTTRSVIATKTKQSSASPQSGIIIHILRGLPHYRVNRVS